MSKNYFLIVEQLTSGLANSFESKNIPMAKKISNEFKNNPLIAALHSLMENFKSDKITPEGVDSYIQENILLASEYDFKSLDKFITEDSKKFETNLLKDLTTVLFTQKNIHNLADYTQSYENVKSHLIENYQWKGNIQRMLVSLETQMDDLDDDDKALVENYIKMDLAGKDSALETTKKECIDTLMEKIKHSKDDSEKVKLYEAKEQILNKTLNENDKNSHISDLIKLHNLKKDLLNS